METPTRLDVAMAAGATLVATAFALSTLDRWLRRRRPQEQAWTVSLALFALGSGALWWALARGWSSASFRVFYLAGAILTVPWLALGSVSLIALACVVARLRTALVWVSGLATGVLLAAPLRAPIPRHDLPEGREVFGVWPRALAAVGSGVAATTILVIAALTTVRFVRRRVDVPARRLVGNLLIAGGTMILSASGSLAGRLGAQRAFVVTLAVGISVLFAGFLAASIPVRRPAARFSPGGAAAASR